MNVNCLSLSLYVCTCAHIWNFYHSFVVFFSIKMVTNPFNLEPIVVGPWSNMWFDWWCSQRPRGFKHLSGSIGMLSTLFVKICQGPFLCGPDFLCSHTGSFCLGFAGWRAFSGIFWFRYPNDGRWPQYVEGIEHFSQSFRFNFIGQYIESAYC